MSKKNITRTEFENLFAVLKEASKKTVSRRVSTYVYEDADGSMVAQYYVNGRPDLVAIEKVGDNVFRKFV